MKDGLVATTGVRDISGILNSHLVTGNVRTERVNTTTNCRHLFPLRKNFPSFALLRGRVKTPLCHLSHDLTCCAGRNRVRNQSDRTRRHQESLVVHSPSCACRQVFFLATSTEMFRLLKSRSDQFICHSEKQHLTQLWRENSCDALLDLLIENCYRLRNTK